MKKPAITQGTVYSQEVTITSHYSGSCFVFSAKIALCTNKFPLRVIETTIRSRKRVWILKLLWIAIDHCHLYYSHPVTNLNSLLRINDSFYGNKCICELKFICNFFPNERNRYFKQSEIIPTSLLSSNCSNWTLLCFGFFYYLSN